MKNCLKGFALFHLRKFPGLGQLPRENLSKTFKSKCIRCCFLTNSWGKEQTTLKTQEEKYEILWGVKKRFLGI